MAKINKIVKRTDSYSLTSEARLKEIIEANIKKVYVGALKCIEMRFGDDFEGFDQIRREILRNGNDAVRNISDLISSRFNVEIVPDVVTVNFTNIGKEVVTNEEGQSFQG